MEVVPTCEVILELQPVEVTSRPVDVIPDQPEGLYQTCKQRMSYQTNRKGYTRPANSGGILKVWYTRPSTIGDHNDLSPIEVITDLKPEDACRYSTCESNADIQSLSLWQTCVLYSMCIADIQLREVKPEILLGEVTPNTTHLGLK